MRSWKRAHWFLWTSLAIAVFCFRGKADPVLHAGETRISLSGGEDPSSLSLKGEFGGIVVYSIGDDGIDNGGDWIWDNVFRCGSIR